MRNPFCELIRKQTLLLLVEPETEVPKLGENLQVKKQYQKKVTRGLNGRDEPGEYIYKSRGSLHSRGF